MHNANFKISSRLALLNSGLYVVRCSAGLAGDHPDCITLNPSPIGRGTVDFFPAEGVSRNTLAKAGDCIVVRVKGDQASILITEFKTASNTTPIEIRIDRVTPVAKETDEDATQPAAPRAESSVTKPTSLRTTLTGHIERTGDVSVDAGWLGSPDSIHRIEGFSVTVPDIPEGVVLAYSCRCGVNGETDVGMAGKFVGTRRQAKPITAVAFALSGEHAASFELTGKVAFAACPPLAIVPGQELSGPTGTEQLVALQLSITAKATQASPPASPWSDASRTKIFS